MTGDGVGKPLGMFIASDDGISTARDVTTIAADELAGDDVINAKYTLKQAYWGRAGWLMHRSVLLTLALTKDNDGQYMWRESLAAGEPSTLAGFPVVLSEFAPSTISTGAYIAILGDLSNYWIVDGQTMEVQILRELYAVNNQIGYLINYSGDGAPVLEEAFVRIKVGSGS